MLLKRGCGCAASSRQVLTSCAVAHSAYAACCGFSGSVVVSSPYARTRLRFYLKQEVNAFASALLPSGTWVFVFVSLDSRVLIVEYGNGFTDAALEPLPALVAAQPGDVRRAIQTAVAGRGGTSSSSSGGGSGKLGKLDVSASPALNLAALLRSLPTLRCQLSK